jgi:glucokinase
VSAVIGVDLGGTKVAVATLRGQVLGKAIAAPTDCSGPDQLIDQLVELIESQRHDGDLDAVGLGVPSVVEFETGRVISSVNIPLANVPLRHVLSERLGVPVFVDNDATVAALAEAHDEQLQLVARNLVILTVGTGLGGGLVLGGRIYRGATGAAAELGHQVVGIDLSDRNPVPPPSEGFPRVGSLEYVASGHALDRMAAETASADPESELGRLAATGHRVLGPDAVKAARDGDRAAVRLVEIWAERVGIGIANAINTFDPEEVVIGGGAAEVGEMLIEPARQVAAGYILTGVGTRTTVRLARHGLAAGVLGAALLAVYELQPNAPASEVVA